MAKKDKDIEEEVKGKIEEEGKIDPSNKVDLRKKRSSASLQKALKIIASKSDTLVDLTSPLRIEGVPSGSTVIDNIINLGGQVKGFPRGRITEIHGWESAGKTTLMLASIAACQKLGYVCAFIDFEHAFHSNYAKRLGVDLESLILSQPMSIEQGEFQMLELLRTGEIDALYVDSVPAMTPAAILEGRVDPDEAGSTGQIGLQARLFTEFVTRMSKIISEYETALILANQMRANFKSGWGQKAGEAAGANALKFYASVRIELTRIKSIKAARFDYLTQKKEQVVIANIIQAQTVKNKCAPPFRKGIFRILFGEGIDDTWTVSELAKNLGVIDFNKTGYWIFKCDTDESLSISGRGGDEMYDLLKTRPDVVAELERRISLALIDQQGEGAAVNADDYYVATVEGDEEVVVEDEDKD